MLGLIKRDPRYKQGFYHPVNKEKFIAEYAVYRSSLELLFFKFCDRNENVLKWGSECIVVQYYDSLKKRMRKYFIDNYVVIKEGNVTKKYLVEIKPYKQTLEPVPSKNKKKSTLLYESVAWVTNCSKWDSAREYAKKHGMEFIIITEKDLNP